MGSGAPPAEIGDRLPTRPGLSDLHDLHVWPISTAGTALAVHLVSGKGSTL